MAKSLEDHYMDQYVTRMRFQFNDRSWAITLLKWREIFDKCLKKIYLFFLLIQHQYDKIIKIFFYYSSYFLYIKTLFHHFSGYIFCSRLIVKFQEVFLKTWLTHRKREWKIFALKFRNRLQICIFQGATSWKETTKSTIFLLLRSFTNQLWITQSYFNLPHLFFFLLQYYVVRSKINY